MKYVFIILFLLITSISLADEIKIPFVCNQTKLQELFLSKGYILDASPSEKTKYSWGFIKNEGSRFLIYTYRSVSNQELQLIQDLIFKSMKEE